MPDRRPRPSAGARGGGPWRALTRRALRDARTRAVAFAYLFAAVGYINPATYASAYPSLAARIAFARGFAHNTAVVLFYGRAYSLLSAGGYTAWRTGGTLALLAGVFGVFAAVRAMRTEEDAGRAELVLAGCAGRRTVFDASLAAIAGGIALLGVAELIGLVLAGLDPGASAYLALATASVALVFAAVGALASQLAPTRRMALQLALAVFVAAFLLRVLADTAAGVAWLRWLSPLGWAELARPFTGAQPLALVAPVATSAVLLAASAVIAMRRDIGAGLIATRGSSKPHLRLLSSPTAHALREERASLAAWLAGTAAFALILGIVSRSSNRSVISPALERQLAKLGSPSITTPRGYLAFAFIFLVLTLSAFACAQVGAARHEEEQERLETLLALPVGRRGWLVGRLALAAAGVLALALAAGILTWLGAQLTGTRVPLADVLAAAANCLPVALLFLGVAALAYAVLPRAANAIAYGLLATAFLWYLFGSLVGVPRWVIDATPFAHVAAVPVQRVHVLAAAVMITIGLASAAAALARFRRRDLLGA